MTDRDKLTKLKDWVLESRAQLQEERRDLEMRNHPEKEEYLTLLIYRESIIDQVSQILEDDV